MPRQADPLRWMMSPEAESTIQRSARIKRNMADVVREASLRKRARKPHPVVEVDLLEPEHEEMVVSSDQTK